jgi:iron complex outermembrane receptor protein
MKSIFKNISLLVFILMQSHISMARGTVIKEATVDSLFGINSSIHDTLSGKVIDIVTGKVLVGASVSIPDLNRNTVTDSSGTYHFYNLPHGSYLIEISYVSYKTLLKNIINKQTVVIDFALKSSVIEESEVIVTGVSKATSMKKDPVPMVAIGTAYINEHSASGNVIAEIANVPGVNAVTTGPNISKPYIRGLGYNRVVTAVDGIRQEGQQWGDEHGIEVDQNSIDRVEIIKGPASLSFGPDAIGGVVNLLTSPTVPKGKIVGAASSIYGTNNGLINGSFKLQGNNNGFVWTTILSDKEAKNYQNQHDGRVYATGFRKRCTCNAWIKQIVGLLLS